MADDSTLYDLSGFPPPQAIAEIASEEIINRMAEDLVERYPDIAGFVNLESEPSRKLIEVFAYRETLIRARVNDAVRANLLRYATGADLDNLAVFYDVVRMTGELDDRLKRRVILAIQGRSTGGTKPRYEGIAMGASLRVASAVAFIEGTRPVVNIAVYSTDNGGVADAPLLELVRQAVNADDKRMLSDTIVVRPAVFSTVNIAADIWLLPETPDTILATLVTGLREAWALETGLGFDLTPAWITARLMKAGVQNVVVTAPSAPVVAPPQNAIALGTITLTDRGRTF